MLGSVEIFEASIHSDHTLRTYKQRLEEFHNYTKTHNPDEIKDYDSYLGMDPKQVQNLIIKFVIHLQKKLKLNVIGPNAFPQRLSPIFLFMSQNDIIINSKKIKKMFPRKIKKKGELPYTIEDLQALQSSTINHRDKAIISFFASTGVRPEAILDLKMKNLKDMDLGCMAVTIYENDPEEYPGFLIPEAVKKLKNYFAQREFHGEKITDETPIFRNHYRKKLAWRDVKPMNENSLKSAMTDIIYRAGLRKRYTDSGQKHSKAMFGAFRKFFETTLNNINEMNSNITEKLMGHRNDLRGTYYNPDLKTRFEAFKIAIPYLTISDKQRDSLKIQRLENKDDKIQELSSIVEKQGRKIELHEKEIKLAQELYKIEKEKHACLGDPDKLSKILLKEQDLIEEYVEIKTKPVQVNEKIN